MCTADNACHLAGIPLLSARKLLGNAGGIMRRAGLLQARCSHSICGWLVIECLCKLVLVRCPSTAGSPLTSPHPCTMQTLCTIYQAIVNQARTRQKTSEGQNTSEVWVTAVSCRNRSASSTSAMLTAAVVAKCPCCWPPAAQRRAWHKSTAWTFIPALRHVCTLVPFFCAQTSGVGSLRSSTAVL